MSPSCTAASVSGLPRKHRPVWEQGTRAGLRQRMGMGEPGGPARTTSNTPRRSKATAAGGGAGTLRSHGGRASPKGSGLPEPAAPAWPEEGSGRYPRDPGCPPPRAHLHGSACSGVLRAGPSQRTAFSLVTPGGLGAWGPGSLYPLQGVLSPDCVTLAGGSAPAGRCGTCGLWRLRIRAWAPDAQLWAQGEGRAGPWRGSATPARSHGPVAP